MARNIDERLVEIVYNELGESSSKLFYDFYHDFSLQEQVQGVGDILKTAVGHERSAYLLNKFKKEAMIYES